MTEEVDPSPTMQEQPPDAAPDSRQRKQGKAVITDSEWMNWRNWSVESSVQKSVLSAYHGDAGGFVLAPQDNLF